MSTSERDGYTYYRCAQPLGKDIEVRGDRWYESILAAGHIQASVVRYTTHGIWMLRARVRAAKGSRTFWFARQMSNGYKELLI
jgi:hypothetical protein